MGKADGEKEEVCPTEIAGSCMQDVTDNKIGKWVVECWYSMEVDCTGDVNWCNAAILTRNGHWIDGTCDEVQAHAEEVKAKKKERKQERLPREPLPRKSPGMISRRMRRRTSRKIS